MQKKKSINMFENFFLIEGSYVLKKGKEKNVSTCKYTLVTRYPLYVEEGRGSGWGVIQLGEFYIVDLPRLIIYLRLLSPVNCFRF